jgi:hypothetical protein
MADKKLSELPLISAINAEDISLLVSDGTDYKFAFTSLLQFIGDNLNIGAKVSVGTVLPSNSTGKNGDLFIKTDTGAFVQKVSGVWTVVYTIPSSTGITNGTILYGVGVPGGATGSDNDTYINTGTGVFYKKASGTWGQVFSMQTGPQGPQGVAGTNGTNGTNGFSVLNGITTPSNSTTGVNGDFYINTSTYTLYGPKTGGAWGDGVSLIGSGLPNGGSTGQVLVKSSNDDLDVDWSNIGVSFENLTGDVSDSVSLSAALSGKADLVSGKVPSGQLPSYVDDVLEFADFASLPGTGEASKIYVTLDDNCEYRWSGSTYIQLVASPGSTDAVPEGSTNKYFTAARVLASLLTGIGFSTATAVVATDSILTAFGKLQAQINSLFGNTVKLTGETQQSVEGILSPQGIVMVSDITAQPGEACVSRLSLGSHENDRPRVVRSFTGSTLEWTAGSNTDSSVWQVGRYTGGVLADYPLNIDKATGKIYKADGKAMLFDPGAGTAGQILTKIDSAEGNMHWVDAPGVADLQDQITAVENEVTNIHTDNITLSIYKNSNYATP